MNNLNSNDKYIIELFLNMSGGYVLDFTNNSLQEFFSELNIDIMGDSYNLNSGSKANRVRAFL
jgi:hypothetical protein